MIYFHRFVNARTDEFVFSDTLFCLYAENIFSLGKIKSRGLYIRAKLMFLPGIKLKTAVTVCTELKQSVVFYPMENGVNCVLEHCYCLLTNAKS